MGKPIAEVSADTLKLQAFIEGRKPGDEITFVTVEEVTGVKMDLSGRAKLRTAIKRAKREYSALKGEGVKLADAGMVMPLLASSLIKIDRSVKRGSKRQKTLQSQFFDALSPEEQHNILFCGAVFGAIRIAAENGKLLYKKNKDGITMNPVLSIPIPKTE